MKAVSSAKKIPRRKGVLVAGMRKVLVALFIFIFIFSNAVAFAQMPVAGPGVLPLPSGLEKIGVVAAAKGKVELTTPGQVGRIASSGQEIFMGDEVRTDGKGHLQILLLDETVFTIGPDSSITIDEFVYDPKTHDGIMKASVTRGIFRYVSGRIAAKKPDRVAIKLPTATMGIRGTIIAGEINRDRSALVALLGPGDKNDAGARIGSFVMTGTGDNAGEKQEVNRTGFGVQIGANGSVSGALQLSTADVSRLASGLVPHANQQPGLEGPPGEDQGGGQPGARPQDGRSGEKRDSGQTGPRPPAGQPRSDQAMGPAHQGGELSPLPPGAEFLGDGSVTKMSGEGMAIAKDTVRAMNTLGRFIGIMDWQSQQPAQDSAGTHNNSGQSFRETTQNDMNQRSAPTLVNYQGNSAPFLLGGISSVLKAFINVNFSTQELVGVGPNRSYFQIKQGAATVDSCEFLGAQNFSTMESSTDKAKFFLSGGSEITQFAPAGTFNSITIEFQNTAHLAADGTVIVPEVWDIASRAKVTVDYTSAALQNVVVETMAPQQS